MKTTATTMGGSVLNLISDKKNNERAKTSYVKEKSRIVIKGDLMQENYIKSDIPIEELVPTQNQGIDNKFRTTFLYDPKNEKHKELKYYKTILDNA